MPGEKRHESPPAAALPLKRHKAPPSGVVVPTNLVECNGKSCTHQVFHPPDAYESGDEPSSAPPRPLAGTPAREFPFQVDPFQQTAINALEAGHNVLVAAHTSAGKTAIAEYAFGMALRDGGRVVYTSPLKALSNQKYRELQEEFGDVGLMTGDVTINPNASCLVMTTEILRSMLYNGSEVVREVQLLVYDEIHYMRDKERGVVWEESIILAPRNARFAFLSATIPNAGEFARWVAKTHNSPCDVVYTDFRPTPLQHFVFPAGGSAMQMVVDDKSHFSEEKFHKVAAEVAENAKANVTAKKNEKEAAKKNLDTGENSDIYKVVKMVLERNFDPVIVFSFSKTEVETLSGQMVSMDLNSDEEKKLTESVFRNAMNCLGEEDRKLPQINEALPMLKRGIGVHHSGLLPILKEVIELLFQEGLLKVLVATETFSTGLNMPAKTVIFNSVRKFDGTGFRTVSSGEYIQMSGRAGRRGLDDRGIVILMMDSRLEPAVAKDMLRGAPDALNSEFQLGYNMLLNLARMSDAHTAEDLLRRSFRQFQAEQALPKLLKQLTDLEAERDSITIADEEAVSEVLLLLRQLAAMKGEMRQTTTIPKYALPFLQPGRLVRFLVSDQYAVHEADTDSNDGSSSLGVTCDPAMAWGIVLNFKRAGSEETAGNEVSQSKSKAASFFVDVLAMCELPTRSSNSNPKLIATGAAGSAEVVSIKLSSVDAFSSIRVYVPKELQSIESKQVAGRSLSEVVKRFPKGLPLLHPREDMHIEEASLQKLVRKTEKLETLLGRHRLVKVPDLLDRLLQMEKKAKKQDEVQLVAKEMKASKSIILKNELKARLRVLRRLEYVNTDGVVSLKGRFAAHINSADEIVLTELVFEGTFRNLTPTQAAALISCFVWQEKGAAAQSSRVREDLQQPLAALKDVARRVAKVSVECKLAADVEEFVSNFRPELMDAVAAWASGSSFRSLLKMIPAFEGSIVRAIRRLHEVLLQLEAACKAVGEVGLQEKFEQASAQVKRDIVFAASLYL
mmetsp:Transcript_37581/g.96143  ORF Transcript_37581/g.96143 Transcript_37581/m.96143 type:complete len:1017 (-) Transcript_37581:98-3148(-)